MFDSDGNWLVAQDPDPILTFKGWKRGSGEREGWEMGNT